jgi:hypothetical protein
MKCGNELTGCVVVGCFVLAIFVRVLSC